MQRKVPGARKSARSGVCIRKNKKSLRELIYRTGNIELSTKSIKNESDKTKPGAMPGFVLLPVARRFNAGMVRYVCRGQWLLSLCVPCRQKAPAAA